MKVWTRSKMITTRKPHKCCKCDVEQPSGSRMHHYSEVEAHTKAPIDSQYTCESCRRALAGRRTPMLDSDKDRFDQGFEDAKAGFEIQGTHDFAYRAGYHAFSAEKEEE